MARGSGQRRVSTWERCSADLVTRGSRFRLRRRSDRPNIYIREIGPSGSVLATFAAGDYRADDDDAVELIYRQCIEAHKLGRWPDLIGGKPAENITWATFAQLVIEDVQRRIAKRSSRAHAEGHLRTIATWSGPVKAQRLERWAMELDPIAEASPFRKRVETLGQVQASGVLDVSDALARLRAMRPKGAARKRQQVATMRPRAIPTDAQLQAWLDQLDRKSTRLNSSHRT